MNLINLKAMKTFFTKILDFFRWIGQKLIQGGKWVVTGLLLLAIIVTGALLADKDEDNNDATSDRPEIAQVFEPSIGDPLPPDVISEEANQENNKVAQETNTGEVAGAVNNTTTTFVAPPTGVNPEAPINYYNNRLGFNSVIPAKANVKEENSTVSFVNENGQEIYTVSKTDGNDSLGNIADQLKLSADVSNIQSLKFNGLDAISFNINDNSGIAFVMNGNIYYLTGDKEYFDQFSVL